MYIELEIAMKHSRLLLLFLFLSFSPTVFALRCSHELVSLGDYKQDVIDKCGEPISIDSHIERRADSNFANLSNRFSNGIRQLPNTAIHFGQQHYTEIEVIVEEWVYDFGHSKFRQYLRFENGRLKEIKRLGRGG